MLAIETTTPGSSVALGDGRRVVASAGRVDHRGHSSFLVPAIDFCFDQAGWVPSDLDAVVIDTGPGLFTGIRVGLATAQGLAAALGVPLYPASSLDALAIEAKTGHRHIWAIVDVRRGEIAVASYRPVPGGVVRDDEPALVNFDHFWATLESDKSEVLLVGDASALPEGLLRGMHWVRVGDARYPTASALIEIGANRAEKVDPPAMDEMRPMYLRDPDVTINWSILRREGPWEAA